ncbi:MAG: protein kinase [Ilumatobacter sp.]
MDARAKQALETALPAYDIDERLGRGAFGVVWAARHTQLGRRVAIKQLPQAFVVDEAIRGRFVDEAQTVAALEHPHIVPVYDFVENSEVCLLIMERCADSVGDRFKADGIATDEACAAVLACLAALDHAHARGVLHRDVKPENLMYDMSGTVKLADFGIARALDQDVRRTATGMVVGTPAYMSPEQVRGETLSEASDVYSVAVMAYELLTGTLPFPDSEAITGLLAHHLVTEPTPMLVTRPELPGAIGSVIDRALAKDLAQRHATALEFGLDLSRACVTAFGSGWLRRRRFTLHWPDVVAENERTGPESPRTGTIVVQAQDTPHEVITPSVAIAGDIVAPTPPSPPGTSQPSPPFPPAASAPPAQPTASPPTTATPPPFTPSAPATPNAAASPPPAPTSPAAPTGRRSNAPFIAVAAVLALIVIVGGAIALTRGGGDTTNEATSEVPLTSDPLLDEPVADGATAPESIDGETDGTGDPVTDPTSNGGGPTLQGPPDDYRADDATEFTAPTPCPTEPDRVACLFSGVSADTESGALTFGWFVDGFVPDIDGGGDRVHFYFDTAVDGDENAAGTAAPGGDWVQWDAAPPLVNGNDVPAGLEMLTIADAEAVDARHLCAIVADANGVAVPGTGNCAPITQLWDQTTLSLQVNRLSGRWIGGCGVGVSAIVPDDWRHVDLTTMTPADAAAELFPGNAEAATVVFQSFVSSGAVLYAVGPAAELGGAEVTLVVSSLEAGVTLASTPAETDAVFAALGISTEPSVSRLINDRQIATTSSQDATTATERYRLPDFGTAFELSLSAAAGNDLAPFADRVAATVIGC